MGLTAVGLTAVGLTAVGLFGKGGGWAISMNSHTLDVAVGGIANKLGVVDGSIAIREYLCTTLRFDHDIMDTSYTALRRPASSRG